MAVSKQGARIDLTFESINFHLQIANDLIN